MELTMAVVTSDIAHLGVATTQVVDRALHETFRRAVELTFERPLRAFADVNHADHHESPVNQHHAQQHREHHAGKREGENEDLSHARPPWPAGPAAPVKSAPA